MPVVVLSFSLPTIVSAATDFLFDLPRFTDQGAVAYRPGLERMWALMEAMGQPHEQFESVHVAGTNGKGSTASLLAAIATACGKRVGLHTSPHLFSLTERMRIDGAPAPEAWLERAVERYRETFEVVRPSFFEATTALSFLYFAEQKVDLAVIEVGLGGRLDATNVIRPAAALITNIGLEHTDLLGTTHADIAREKAGIIKPGVPVLTTAGHPDAIAVIRATAEHQRAPYHHIQEEVEITSVDTNLHGLILDVQTPERRYKDLHVGLPGRHQQWNAVLALRAAELILTELRHDSGCLYEGLQHVRRLSGLRGRFDILREHPAIVADVAHNAEGLTVTLEALEPVLEGRSGRLFVLLGAMQDKDVGRMADLLASARATVFCVTIDSDRAYRAGALCDLLRKHGVNVIGAGLFGEGWERFQHEMTRDDVLLVTGSHQVVAQAPVHIDDHPE